MSGKTPDKKRRPHTWRGEKKKGGLKKTGQGYTPERISFERGKGKKTRTDKNPGKLLRLPEPLREK